jgi:predicted dehydrogenase
VVIGAGGIVRSAHLPTYRSLGFPVAGVYDVRTDAAAAVAREFSIPTVFATLATAAAAEDAVYDIAVPADQVLPILAQLPRGSGVLIQKPMGPDLAAAAAIRNCCRDRGLTAAVNFQLRFSPNVLALRDLLTHGALGTIVDVDVRIVIDQPWHLWPFLEGAPRLEVPYHSIHYLDAIRWLIGEPESVYCRVARHPSTPHLADTRSSIILGFAGAGGPGRAGGPGNDDDWLRCSLTLNHTHRAGPRHRASEMTVEGDRGAARLTWGVNLAYPQGPPDTMEIGSGGEWRDVPLRGSWFTTAFEGPMSNLQRVLAGEDAVLVSGVDDAIKTMAVVEACYTSSAHGGTPIPRT